MVVATTYKIFFDLEFPYTFDCSKSHRLTEGVKINYRRKFYKQSDNKNGNIKQHIQCQCVSDKTFYTRLRLQNLQHVSRKNFHYIYKSIEAGKNFTNSTIANCKALGKEASLKKCPKKDTIAVIPISGYRN